MTNLAIIFGELMLKKKMEDEHNNTKSDLNNALNQYIELCERYVYHKTGYTIKAYNRDFPFDDIVNQVDGVRFTRDVSDVFNKYFVTVTTENSFMFVFNSKVTIMRLANKGSVWINKSGDKLTNASMLSAIQKVKERTNMLRSEIGVKVQ